MVFLSLFSVVITRLMLNLRDPKSFDERNETQHGTSRRPRHAELDKGERDVQRERDVQECKQERQERVERERAERECSEVGSRCRAGAAVSPGSYHLHLHSQQPHSFAAAYSHQQQGSHQQ
jgi:hypothetical protein